MKKLTREQELNVIRSLSPEDAIANGGGRIVFELSADMNRALELPNKDYVVKIALGDKGLNQNELEIEQYIKHRDEVSLAEIAAIGHIIIIMERVDTDFTGAIRDIYDDDYYFDDIYDLPSGYLEEDPEEFDDPAFEYLTRQLIFEYGWDRGQAEDRALSIFNILSALDDIYGSTADNAQIGLNSDGYWVAFDYGFDPEKSCSEQCSNTRNYLDDDEWCDIFINTIIENIYNNPELWEYSPHGLMKDVEEEFFNYIFDDERDTVCINTTDTSDEYFTDSDLRPASKITTDITYTNSCLIHPVTQNWYNMKNILDNAENKLYTIYLN